MARYRDIDKIISEIDKAPAYFRHNGDVMYGLEIAKAIIENTLPADVAEVKHGEWECVNESENVWMCTGADGCGGEILLLEGTPHDYDWNYCPYCGAKMDGGK